MRAILRVNRMEGSARRRAPAHKLFAGRAASELWFDWDQSPGHAHEARLSRLARWVMLAEERGLRYG